MPLKVQRNFVKQTWYFIKHFVRERAQTRKNEKPAKKLQYISTIKKSVILYPVKTCSKHKYIPYQGWTKKKHFCNLPPVGAVHAARLRVAHEEGIRALRELELHPTQTRVLTVWTLKKKQELRMRVISLFIHKKKGEREKRAAVFRELSIFF